MASSVWTYGLTASDIGGRTGITYSASTTPTSTVVGELISEACGLINVKLESIGTTPSVITSGAHANLYYAIRGRVISAVAAYAHEVNQADRRSFAEGLEERWREWLEQLKTEAEKILGAAAPSRSRSNVTAGSLADPPETVWGDRGFD